MQNSKVISAYFGACAGIGVNAWPECPVGSRNKFGMTFFLFG